MGWKKREGVSIIPQTAATNSGRRLCKLMQTQGEDQAAGPPIQPSLLDGWSSLAFSKVLSPVALGHPNLLISRQLAIFFSLCSATNPA